MNIKKLSTEERIKYAELFLKVREAVLNGGTISKKDAQTAYDAISALIDKPAFTEKERDELADLGIMINQIEEDLVNSE